MAAERMIKAAADFPAAGGIQKEALNQLGRELLLAQASDWPFIMASGTMVRYAREQVEDHLVRFNRLLEQVYSAKIEQEWLEKLKTRDNLFPNLDYRSFVAKQTAIKLAAWH